MSNATSGRPITGAHVIIEGDVCEVLRDFDTNTFDACFCDPPYLYEFMNKSFDKQHKAMKGANDGQKMQAWHEAWCREVYRVLKPGGFVLAFGGTRTVHRLASALEDAGFEPRDMLCYLFGSGFPKSANILKSMNKVPKALDKAYGESIIRAWIESSDSARLADLQSLKRETETGTSMPRSDSALASVVLSVSQENSHASAIIAELCSIEARRIKEVSLSFALTSAESYTTELSVLVTIAECSRESQGQMPFMADSSALCDAWGCLAERTMDNLKAAEVLRTWLGRKKCSEEADTDALCVALTEDLKLIILSQSETFLSLDTIQRTDCVSAISVTITESTMASLISFTVNTLKRRETDCWRGYGTALKPAVELLTLAMKPTDGTFAQNALTWSVAGLNIDAGRIPSGTEHMRGEVKGRNVDLPGAERTDSAAGMYAAGSSFKANDSPLGRWPANLLLSHHEDCREVGTRRVRSGNSVATESTLSTIKGGLGGKISRHYADADGMEEVTAWECHPECPVRMLDEQAAGKMHSAGHARPFTERSKREPTSVVEFSNVSGDGGGRYGDDGGPSRFFYTAKVSSRERHLGGVDCRHATLKPMALTEYLSRLLLPPARADNSLRQLLIPFSGAGSEVAGALRAGWDLVIGIENDAESVQWAEARVAAAVRETETGIREPGKGRRKVAVGEQTEVVEPSAKVETDAECESPT